MAKERINLPFEEEEACFYHELGLAITQWASVEHQLLFVLAYRMSKEQLYFMRRGYLSINVFQQKLIFVNSLVEQHPPGKITLEHWRQLAERCSRSNSLRNKLAHRPSVHYPRASQGRRVALTDWFPQQSEAASRAGRPPNDAICLLDLVHIRQSFYALTCALTNFAHKLKNHVGPFPESLEQSPVRPQLDEVVNRIRAILKPPLRPSA